MAHKIYSSTHGFNGYSQGCYYFIMAARLDVGTEQCLDHAFQVIFQIVLDILYIGPISRFLWVWQLAWLKNFNAFHLVKHGVVAAVDLVPSVNVSRAQKRLFPFPHKFRLVSASVGPKDPVLAHIVRVGFVPAHVVLWGQQFVETLLRCHYWKAVVDALKFVRFRVRGIFQKMAFYYCFDCIQRVARPQVQVSPNLF